MERQISEPSVTYQGILDLPEKLEGEIINGRLVTHPRLTGKARYAKDRLADVLSFNFCFTASTDAHAKR